ncbi:hypothetical protein GCM10010327_55020 [Streptomyces nitrosporeus]|nr:hypothetical protein GCM10010327_55020 [Streptomyces nitrosporeus]
MTGIVKRNARAILLDGDELVLIKRTEPGREPYWVSVGGGAEEENVTIEAALHREEFDKPERGGHDAVRAVVPRFVLPTAHAGASGRLPPPRYDRRSWTGWSAPRS